MKTVLFLQVASMTTFSLAIPQPTRQLQEVSVQTPVYRRAIWFYPHRFCAGSIAIGCDALGYNECCTLVQFPAASVNVYQAPRTPQRNSVIVCAHSDCEGPCYIMTYDQRPGIGKCMDTPTAVYSGEFLLGPGLNSNTANFDADALIWDSIQSSEKQNSSACIQANSVKWQDADGKEVITSIPEGRLEELEVVAAGKKVDMQKLKELLNVDQNSG
ncbi:hypothetical protein BJ508DRAFT_307924 [Ascobolus immersus RN42]|uniref:Uncharacterized protein n=1 Tax=Ascobolus immersus RN42 TaxID=1160509 RepID=A0A3N4I6T1_ASCIM|nr:hypothetical protein BJ508DRAFT_307924 [Ascobolus immersus RN42]